MLHVNVTLMSGVQHFIPSFPLHFVYFLLLTLGWPLRKYYNINLLQCIIYE